MNLGTKQINSFIFGRHLVLLSFLLSAPIYATSANDKLYDSLSQITVSADREPEQGSIRSDAEQTDIRTVFQTPDGREGVVTIWSPRVHPFKAPPSYNKVRPCLFGEYHESTIGIIDTTKTRIFRQAGRDPKISEVFLWSDKSLALTPDAPLPKPPQKYEFLGKVFEFEKTGRCNYHPAEKKENENARVYFYKHLELAKKANATDIIFPKTVFNLISQTELTDPSFDYVLPISNLTDMRIEFNHSTFLLPPTRGGFVFQNSQRIALSKLSLEWAFPEKNLASGYSGALLHGIYAPRSNNTDLWFEKVNMKRVPGWGFYFDSLRGGLVSDSSISSIPGDLMPAAREGALHSNNSQNLVIRDNNFSNLGSDGIILHGQFAKITTPLFTPKATTIEPGFSNCVGIGSSWRPFSPGETLGFFNPNLEFQGEIKLRTVQTFSFSDPALPGYCKGYAFCSQACFGPHPEFKPEEFGFATSVSTNSALFIIHGNNLSHIQGQAIKVQGSNGIISENLIEDTGGAGIHLGADLARQLQGPGAFNILVKNNILRRVVTSPRFLSPQEPFFGGITVGSAFEETDGRRIVLRKPFAQHIRIEGTNSLVEDSGSVGLQISSASHIEIRSLTLGAAGLMRTLSSGQLTGSSAEGSVLLNHSSHIDLSGLTTPNLGDLSESRNRTIVIDGQDTTHLRVPVTTKAVPGKTANTVWNLTFRSFFAEKLGEQLEPMVLNITSPALSTFYKEPPFTAATVISPKVGDKEQTAMGKQIELTTSSTQWSATAEHSIFSPSRIQIRPLTKKQFSDLFLSIESILMAPKKSKPMPFES